MSTDSPQAEGSPTSGATLSPPVAPTSAAEWKSKARDQSGFLVTLPSGLVAKVTRRAADFMTMLKENRIPNPLSEIITKAISGNAVALTEIDDKKMAALIIFVDTMCCQIMLEPKCVQPPDKLIPNINYVSAEDSTPEKPATTNEAPFVPNPLFMEWTCPDDAITPNDMDLNDRFFLFNVAIGGSTDLERFRQGQVPPPASAPDGQGVQPEAVVVPAPPGNAEPRPTPSMVL